MEFVQNIITLLSFMRTGFEIDKINKIVADGQTE